ncbi:MAG: hypothetical protein IIC75_08735, partial [Bacteroidetes bacterium]|nr:hypothetical protein [Bacteroidota bacterium]
MKLLFPFFFPYHYTEKLIENVYKIIRIIIDWLIEGFNDFNTELVSFILFLLTTFIYKNRKKLFILLNTNIHNLLRTQKSKFEFIQIEGTTTINKSFKEKVITDGKKQKYRAGDFYLAKQYDYCQW